MWLLGFYINTGNNKLNMEEFRDIFLENYPGLCLFALRYVDDINTAKDITQDVFVTFWTENEKLNNKNLIKSYLYKSVKNRALNFIKREKRTTGLDKILSSEIIFFNLEDKGDIIRELSFNNLQTDLENAISELPEQRQIIFRMSRFQQMKHKEIAEKLNISSKTVETQIYRSLIFLRKKLYMYLND